MPAARAASAPPKPPAPGRRKRRAVRCAIFYAKTYTYIKVPIPPRGPPARRRARNAGAAGQGRAGVGGAGVHSLRVAMSQHPAPRLTSTTRFRPQARMYWNQSSFARILSLQSQQTWKGPLTVHPGFRSSLWKAHTAGFRQSFTSQLGIFTDSDPYI